MFRLDAVQKDEDRLKSKKDDDDVVVQSWQKDEDDAVVQRDMVVQKDEDEVVLQKDEDDVVVQKDKDRLKNKEDDDDNSMRESDVKSAVPAVEDDDALPIKDKFEKSKKDENATRETTLPKTKEVIKNEDDAEEENWELELNEIADASKSRSVHDLLSFLEASKNVSSSHVEKTSKKESEKVVPPHIQKEVHDILSNMLTKKRQRKLSLKNIVQDHIDTRKSATRERTPIEMAAHANMNLLTKNERAASISSQRPRRAKTHHNFG